LHDNKREEIQKVADDHIPWYLGFNEVIDLAEKMHHHIDGNESKQAQKEELEKFLIQVFGEYGHGLSMLKLDLRFPGH
jgi:hypothetical protein